jgi:hypothetical protein
MHIGLLTAPHVSYILTIARVYLEVRRHMMYDPDPKPPEDEGQEAPVVDAPADDEPASEAPAD